MKKKKIQSRGKKLFGSRSVFDWLLDYDLYFAFGPDAHIKNTDTKILLLKK